MTDEKTFSQEELNKLVGEARVKARELAKSEMEAVYKKEKEVETSKSLKEAAEWETLAKSLEVRVGELEPLTAQVEGFNKLVEKMLAERIKSLGEGAKTAVGALPETMTPMQKLDWLTANAELFQMQGDGVGTPPNLPVNRVREKGSRISNFPIKF